MGAQEGRGIRGKADHQRGAGLGKEGGMEGAQSRGAEGRTRGRSRRRRICPRARCRCMRAEERAV